MLPEWLCTLCWGCAGTAPGNFRAAQLSVILSDVVPNLCQKLGISSILSRGAASEAEPFQTPSAVLACLVTARRTVSLVTTASFSADAGPLGGLPTNDELNMFSTDEKVPKRANMLGKSWRPALVRNWRSWETPQRSQELTARLPKRGGLCEVRLARRGSSEAQGALGVECPRPRLQQSDSLFDP